MMQKSGIDVIAINNEASVRYLCQSMDSNG